MLNQIDYKKKGKVEVKCERSLLCNYRNYKSREIVVHSTLLSIYKRKSNITDNDTHLQFIVDLNRALDDPTNRIRDFLLAPIGMYTEITQVGEVLLVIVSKREVSNISDHDEIVKKKKYTVLQELTLKFETREEREEWMRAIIAECDKNYLTGLLNSDKFDGFLQSANEEVWSAILLGDEALRKAYIAPIGSDSWEVVRIVVKVVIDWIQLLLDPSIGVVEIQPKHKKIFVAFFSLMMQDTAARALLLLVRPDPLFLKDFQKDTAAGEYLFPGEAKEKTKAETAEKELHATMLSFVDFFKLKVVQSPGWKRYRAFLSVVDHPAWPQGSVTTAAYDDCHEQVASPTDELRWMRTVIAKGPFEVSWPRFRSGIDDSPYLSYFFITQEISDSIDDIKVHKVLQLLKRVPPNQLSMTFRVDFVLKPLRQHFLALVNYCKFRMLWKAFYYDHTDSPEQLVNNWKRSFFEEVHKQIWAHIITSPDTYLGTLFLPTTVTSTEVMTFCEVLGQEMANTDDPNLLETLHFTIAPGYVYSPKATAAFRILAVDRLVLWVQSIVGRTELTAEDAPIFIHLLVATAKNPIVRAVLWLVRPANDVPCHDIAGCEGLKYTERFINTLMSQSDLSCRQGGFLSFLTMVEHPLARVVGTGHPLEPASSAVIAAVSLSITSTPLSWNEEMEWMERYSAKGWLFSWSELELLQQPSPYLSLNILIRLYHDGAENILPCIHLLRALRPQSLLDARFEANVNFNSLQFVSQISMGTHFHTFMESRRVVRIWHEISTPLLNSSPRFAEAICSQLVEMLICRPFSLLQKITFGGIISLLVSMELNSGDETRRIVFDNSIAATTATISLPTLTDQHMQDFKSFLDRLARWWMPTNGTESQIVDESGGVTFAKVFHACLDCALLRAICFIIKPRGLALDSAVLSEFSLFVNRSKGNYYFLYFLQLIEHPGIQDSVGNGILQFSEPHWDEESNWLKSCSSIPKLDFDDTDFVLLMKDPAYMLFRYLSKFFSYLDDDKKVYRIVTIIGGMKPGSSGRIFEARANYSSSIWHTQNQAMIPDTDAHFVNILNYCLFFQLWGIVMAKIGKDWETRSFWDAAMYATWLLVTRNVHSSLSTLLLYPDVDEQINQSTTLTYLKVIQRHAIYVIRNIKKLALPQLGYYVRCLPDNFVVDPEELLSHHLLIDRILKWTRCLLGEKVEDAPLLSDILAAATSDVAMRCILVTFVASSSTVRAFMRSDKYEALEFEPRNDVIPPSSEVLLDAARQFIRMLARTVRSERWRQYRCFMHVLEHPVVNAGSVEESEPSWIAESEWIQKRLQMEPATLDWQEWEFVLHDSPYILKVIVTEGFPPEQQRGAMQRISAEHLGASNNAAVTQPIPHFIAMCLEEATQEFVVQAFKSKNMINDKFCEELLNVAYYNQRLPCAFSLLKSLLHTDDYSSPNSCWNASILERMPNVSIVILTFLNKVGQQNTAILDEKLVGDMIMLVFQMESCNAGSDRKSKVSTRASDWMRENASSRTMVT